MQPPASQLAGASIELPTAARLALPADWVNMSSAYRVGVVMNKSCALLAAGLVGAGTVSARANMAEPHTYTYAIEHASYGNIGTFSDTIEQNGDVRKIDSRLRIA